MYTNFLDTLRVLRNANLCVLPAEVRDLQPFESLAWMPNMNSLQCHFHRRLGQAHAEPIQRATTYCVQSASNQFGGTPSTSTVDVELTIQHAPASFSIPQLPRVPLELPFRISVKIASACPQTLSAKVCASCLTCQQVATIHTWKPTPEGRHEHGNVIYGNEIGPELIRLTKMTNEIDQTVMYCGVRDFVFPGIKFARPSDRQPTFLVFHLELPSPAPDIFTLFMVPTVVCDPQNYEFELSLASQILWGGAIPWPKRCSRFLPFTDFEALVECEINQKLELSRPLSMNDIVQLGIQVGYYVSAPKNKNEGNAVCSNNPSVAMSMDGRGKQREGDDDDDDEEEDDEEEEGYMGPRPIMKGGPTWELAPRTARKYITKFQNLMAFIRSYYERTDPCIITAVSVGREESESILHGQPPGTFIIRFAREVGCLAASFVGRSGKISHFKISFELISQKSLEEILYCSPIDFSMLLDVSTGKRYPREEVLDRGYTNDAFYAIKYKEKMFNGAVELNDMCRIHKCPSEGASFNP